MREITFPKDFLWGSATSSYQVEGAVNEGGRVPSIWDTFCAQEGTVLAGDDGSIAADQYHRYQEDIDLMASLGFQAYRFSIAWPRIISDRKGTVNQEGLDYYIKLCKALHEKGMKAVATLYHWDLPQYLQDEGGWDNRAITDAFVLYAKTCFAHLGDYVDIWTTFNEPFCTAYLGYREGIHAPGIRDQKQAYRAVHHLNLAHGLAVAAYRAMGLKNPIGIVLNPSIPRPATRREEDVQAAEIARAFDTDIFLKPLFGQGYPDQLLVKFGIELPIEDGDMEVIAQPLDYVGINYYNEIPVSYDPEQPLHYRAVEPWQRTTNMEWPVTPHGLVRILEYFAQITGNIDLYITENGCAADDVVENGRVYDHFRCDYILQHLEACKRAIKAGVNLKGYFAWSLLDNFEWAWGYSRRFGIIHVDYETQKRTPKNSAYMMRDIIAGYCEYY